MRTSPAPLAAVVDLLASEGVNLPLLGLAWARAMPAVTLVPAFGLRALPVPARAVIALAFAACVFPSLAPVAVASPSRMWLLLALEEVLRGLPVALAAAVPLWAATMAGGVADALRGAQDAATAPTVEGRASPLGIPMSLLACAIFLYGGGPARLAVALATNADADAMRHPLVAAASDLTSGIALAAALGGPLLAAAVVLEIAAALIARAASPAQVHALLAPLRALGTLTVLAIVFDRMGAVLTAAIYSGIW